MLPKRLNNFFIHAKINMVTLPRFFILAYYTKRQYIIKHDVADPSKLATLQAGYRALLSGPFRRPALQDHRENCGTKRPFPLWCIAPSTSLFLNEPSWAARKTTEGVLHGCEVFLTELNLQTNAAKKQKRRGNLLLCEHEWKYVHKRWNIWLGRRVRETRD